jgi:hypothetical protein
MYFEISGRSMKVLGKELSPSGTNNASYNISLKNE